MKIQCKIRALFFGISFVFVIFSCNYKYKELVNYRGADYVFQLQICANSNHVNRLYAYGSNKIVLENGILIDCLSELLDKDISLIKFDNPRKGNVMLNVTYENLSQNPSEKETKKAFLIELKKALKFSLIEEYPENKYQIIIKTDTLLKRHLSINSKDSSSVYSGPGVFRAYNSSLTSIAEGLNNVYKDNAQFVADAADDKRYTFKIENIPFDKLKTYLENKIGLSFVAIDQVKGIKKTTRVIFD
jgi:hypothetical protein